MYYSGVDEGDERRSHIRLLIHRKIPQWELLDQLRKLKITDRRDNTKQIQPYQFVGKERLKKDLKIIAKEDKEWLFDVMKDQWSSSVRQTVNDLQQAQRIALNIALDGTTPWQGKVEALRLFADLGVTANQMTQEGPHVLVRGGKEKVLKELEQSKTEPIAR